jgi:hypothetical protein
MECVSILKMNLNPVKRSLMFSGVLRRLVSWMFIDVSEALMLDEVSTSETSVSIHQTTRRNVPVQSSLYWAP